MRFLAGFCENTWQKHANDSINILYDLTSCFIDFNSDKELEN